MTTAPLSFSAEVAGALAERRPLVALELTIITHGMPRPTNLETARAVEAEIRAAGAVPATIAVLDGRIRIGLEPEELLALSQASAVRKLSRADLAVALACGWTGSTTVAATMIAARLAGIAVFATGGIGGVHRGAETSFDISADLEELAQTAVTVVASGAKAILDLPKTLELLETKGVPVIAFGQDALPAFWSRDLGCRHPCASTTRPRSPLPTRCAPSSACRGASSSPIRFRRRPRSRRAPWPRISPRRSPPPRRRASLPRP